MKAELVVQDFNNGLTNASLYASTPHLSSLRACIVFATCRENNHCLYHSVAIMFRPYMTYLLPFCEFATPAIYHASNAALRHVDHIQEKFLGEMQVGACEALLVHNLAPLATRRDIAMLGVLQECRLGLQLPCTSEMSPTNFLLRGNCYVKPRLQQRLRSVHLRILPVHNMLPYHVANAASVSLLQGLLHDMVKRACGASEIHWPFLLFPHARCS